MSARSDSRARRRYKKRRALRRRSTGENRYYRNRDGGVQTELYEPFEGKKCLDLNAHMRELTDEVARRRSAKRKHAVNAQRAGERDG